MKLEKFLIQEREKEQLAEKHPNMKLLMELVGGINRTLIPDPFGALVNSIVYQQLSYKAADTIWARLRNLAIEMKPEVLLSFSEEELRSCGLSRSKIQYIKNIASAFIEGGLRSFDFQNEPDQEIVGELIKIKGIGQWTAEMFLIFCLRRMDVLSYKDLGIRRGIQWLHGMEQEPDQKQFEEFRKLYSPLNTLASFYLWEITIQDLFRFESIERATSCLLG